MTRYHSITCTLDCTGEWCGCPCHDSDSGGVGRAYGRMGTQDNSGPLGGAGTPLIQGGLATTALGGVS